jgi:hypothetical protein
MAFRFLGVPSHRDRSVLLTNVGLNTYVGTPVGLPPTRREGYLAPPHALVVKLVDTLS